jgi:hypothetical protein
MTVVASKFEREPNELYETEAWATHALIRHFTVAGVIVWEPAAGNHKMVDVLIERGAHVYASDIVHYQKQQAELFDFLRPGLTLGMQVDAIITNPPYGKGNRLAVKFAELALQRCDGLVALLLTAKFDSGKTRHHLFRDNPRFAAKIVLTDRIRWFEGDHDGTEDHAWYVWAERAPIGGPRIIYEGRS